MPDLIPTFPVTPPIDADTADRARENLIRRAGELDLPDSVLFVLDDFRDRATVAQATRVCRSCPVTAECLQDAIKTDDRWAVRGGTTPKERAQMGTNR